MLFSPTVYSQNSDDSLSLRQKFLLKKAKRDSVKAGRWWSFTGYPAYFYLPEVGHAIGAAASYSFDSSKGRDSVSSKSNIRLVSAYTSRRLMMVFMPYSVFWNEDKNYLFGELGFFKYRYFYYGIGNNTLLEKEEVYQVNFPRLYLGYTHKVVGDLGLGVSYWLEDFNQEEVLDGGLVDNVFGGHGSLSSGLGPLLVYDTRNHSIFPEKGWYVEGRWMWFDRFLGSSNTFYKGFVDAMYYYPVHKKAVLATNFNFRFAGGDVPFNMMSMLGGDKKLRGIYLGRYRENNSLLLQSEYRLDLVWRIGLSVFGGLGQVYDRTSYLKMDDWNWTVGGGLRFKLDPQSKLNLRLDYGIGNNQNRQFYLTIGEAF